MNVISFLHETECIYELRIILCMKQCIFELTYNFLYEAECICELRVILCMKQNVFMSLISFLHLTDIISPCSIN